MTISRRGFLAGMLAACAAPAIVKAESLMKVVAPKEVWVPNSKILTLSCVGDSRTSVLDGCLTNANGAMSSLLPGRGLTRSYYAIDESVFIDPFQNIIHDLNDPRLKQLVSRTRA